MYALTLAQRFLAWLLDAEGSSRPSALLRIALALNAWACWASEVRPFDGREPWRIGVGLLFFPATTAMLFGFYSRLSSALAGVALLFLYEYTSFIGVDDYVHHHHYLLSVGILFTALTPCGASFSVDRWLAVRDAEAAGRPPPPERGPLWGTRLITLQLCAVYFWGAWDKTNLPWVEGVRMTQYAMRYYTGSFWPPPAFTAAMSVVAVIVLVTEYTLAFGLPVRRLQPWLVPVGLVLHGLFYVLIPVGTFSTTMWALYLVVVDADAVHRAIDRLIGATARAPAAG